MYLKSNFEDAFVIQLFEAACRDLDLTPTQKENAKKAYEAIGKWLSAPDSNIAGFNPNIYPQGSIRLDTVVKPEGRNEFDVDLVCQLDIDATQRNSEAVYKLLWDRLDFHDTYRNSLRRKNRCVRIIRKDEFHLDVTPAVPRSASYTYNGSIYVPDRELKCWKDSYPKGYAAWFDEKAKIMPQFGLYVLANRKAAASVEPLPDDSGFYKAPLRRLVQLLKRHRDVYFKDKPDVQVISIIITTLATSAYAAVVGKEYQSVYQLLKEVVVKMPDYVEKRQVGAKREFWVANPVIVTENFAEKWNESPARANAFYKWHTDLVEHLAQVEKNKDQGLDVSVKPLRKIFGENVVNRACKAIVGDTSRQHQSGLIQVGRTGSIGVLGTVVRPNTYFGK